MENKTQHRHMPIEQTAMFKRFKAVANEVWLIARAWDSFAKATVGSQLVKAADSIGANLVEGDGRTSDADALRFFGYSRGSSRETQYWIGVACDRKLLGKEVADRLVNELDEAGKMLNGLMEHRKRSRAAGIVREQEALYGPQDERLNGNSDNDPSAWCLEPSAFDSPTDDNP